MFTKKTLILFVGSVFMVCESAFVDTIGKCSIHDEKCHQNLIKKIITDISKTGVPELNIPPIDPIQLKNISVSVLDLLNITLVEGIAKGIKNCKVVKTSANIEKEVASMELLCDITIKGIYKVFSSSPLVKNLLGGETIRGDGVGRVKIENLRMSFMYNFFAQKRDDDIYIQCKYNKTQYDYDIGKMSFAADNLYLGNTEASEMIVNFLNENWKLFLNIFGKNFMDKAMEIVYEYTHNFFDKVPTKYYITDDLTRYVKPRL